MSTNKETHNYDLLRASYRNFIQICTTECKNLNEEQKKHIENIYRTKNVKKSIDTDLKKFCESGKYDFDNDYWKDYNFDENTLNELKSNSKINKFYQDLCNKMNSYFTSEKDNIEFVQPNFEDIKKYLSPEFFSKIQDNLSKYNSQSDTTNNNHSNENTSSNESTGSNENVGIDFPEFVVDLAKELSNEIEIPPELENINEPSELISKIMQEDGQKMVMNLMNKVTTKLQKKIDSGQINQTQMKQQAEECLQNIMKANPAMKEMIDQMVNGMGGAGASQFRQNQSKMNTKERLRQKLEKKKQQSQQVSKPDNDVNVTKSKTANKKKK